MTPPHSPSSNMTGSTDHSSADPDGLLGIKGSYSFRESTPLDAASNKAFFCQQENGELFLKVDHQYFYPRKWCDFVIYILVGISIQRIYFQEDLLKKDTSSSQNVLQ